MAKRIMYDPSTITDDTPVFVKKGDGVVTTEGSGTNTVAQGDSTVPIYIGGKYAGFTVKNINPEMGIEVIIDDSGSTRWLPYNVNERLVPYITVSENSNGYGLNLLGAVAAGITDPIDYANWNISEEAIKNAEALAPYYKDGKIDTKAAYDAGIGEDIIKGYVSEFTAPSNVPTDTSFTPKERIAPYVSSETGSLDPFAAIAAGVTDAGDYEGYGLTQDDIDEMAKLIKYRDPDTKEFRLDDAIEDGWTVDQLGSYFDMSNYVPPSERPVDPVYSKAQGLGVLKGKNLDVVGALEKGMTVAELKTLGVPEESIVQAQDAIAQDAKYAPYITKSNGNSFLNVDDAVADLNAGKLTDDDMKALGIDDNNIRLANIRLRYKTEDGGFDIFTAAEDKVPREDLSAIGYKDEDIQSAYDRAYMKDQGVDLDNFTIVGALEKGIPEEMLLRSTNTTPDEIAAAKDYNKVSKFYDENGRVTIQSAIEQKATDEELKLLGFDADDIKKGRAYDAAMSTMDAGGYWLDDAKTQPNYDKMYEDGQLNLLTDLYENFTTDNVLGLVNEYKNSTKVNGVYLPTSVLNEYYAGWKEMGLTSDQQDKLLDAITSNDGAAYSNLLREYSAADWAKNFSSDPDAQKALLKFVKDDYGNVDPKKISKFLDEYNKAQITGWIKRHVTNKERKNAYLQMVRAGDYDGFDRAYREDNKADVLGTIPAEYQEVVSKWLDTASDEQIQQFVNDWEYAQAKLEARKILDARKEMASQLNIAGLFKDVWKTEVQDKVSDQSKSSVSLRPDFETNAQLTDYTPGTSIEITSESKPWGDAIKLGPSETNYLRNWIVEQVDTTIKDTAKIKDLDTFSDWLGTEVTKFKTGDLTQQDAIHDVSVLTQLTGSYINPAISSFKIAQSIADKFDFDPSIAEKADQVANFAYALANVIGMLENVEQARTDDIVKGGPIAKVLGTANKILDEAYIFDLADMAMIASTLIGHGADYISGYVKKDDDQAINAQAAIADAIAGLLTYPMSVPNTLITDTPQGIAEFAALILPGLPDLGKKGFNAASNSVRRATIGKMFDIKNIVTKAKIDLAKIPTNTKWVDLDPTGAKSVVLPRVEGKITEVTTPGFVAEQFGSVVDAGTLTDTTGNQVGFTKYRDPDTGSTTYLLNAEDGSKTWDVPANQLMWTTLQKGVTDNIKAMPFDSDEGKLPVTVVYGNYRLTDDGNGITATVIENGKALNYVTSDRYSSYQKGGLKPINVTDEGVKSSMFNKGDKPSGIMLQVFDAEDAVISEDGHLRPTTTDVKETRGPWHSYDRVESKDWKAIGKEYAKTAKEIGKVLIDPRLTKGVIQKIKDALGDNVHAKAQLEYALTHMSPEDAKKVVEWAKIPELKKLLDNGEYYKFNRLVGLDKVKIAPTKTYETTRTEQLDALIGNKDITDEQVKDEFQRVGYEGLKYADEVAADGYRLEDVSPNLLADRFVDLIIAHPEWKRENRLLQAVDKDATLYSIFEGANSEVKEAIFAEFPELRQETVLREKLITTKVVENPVIPESKKVARNLLKKIDKTAPKQLKITGSKTLGEAAGKAAAKTLLALLEELPNASKRVGKVLAPVAIAARLAMPASAAADVSLATPIASTQTIDGASVPSESTETKTETVTETVTETKVADINPDLASKNRMPSLDKPATKPASKVMRTTGRTVADNKTGDTTVTQAPNTETKTVDTKNGIENVTKTKVAPDVANKTQLDKTTVKTKTLQDNKTSSKTDVTDYNDVTDVKSEVKISKADTSKVKTIEAKDQAEVETVVDIINYDNTIRNVIEDQIQQVQEHKMDDIDRITKKITETDINIKEPENRKTRLKFPHGGKSMMPGDDDLKGGAALVAWRQGSLTVKGRKRPVWIVIRKKGGKMTKSYEYKAPQGAKVINGKPHQTLYATKKKLKPFKVKVGFNTVTVDLRKTGKDRLVFKNTRKEVSKYKLPTQKQLSGPRFKFR